MTQVPNVKLNNGVEIPQLGFGVWRVPDDEVTAAVLTAIESGYRSIDTAAAYGNEAGTGRAIRESGVPREELFVTTKLWNADQGYDETLRAFDASMERLQLDYLDLYLIHWPLVGRETYIPTWRAFEKLYAEGRIRAIGVSNFQRSHLQRLFEETEVVPAVNQIEVHPYLVQSEMRAFNAEHGIKTESWSPLGGQGSEVLKDPVIAKLGEKYGKTPAQVVLRWHLQHDLIVIPKSVTPSRIRENIDVFDFELTAEEMNAIDALNRNTRTGPDPDTFDYTG